MTASDMPLLRPARSDLFGTAAGEAGSAIQIHLVPEGAEAQVVERLDPGAAAWARAHQFTGTAKRTLMLPGADGRIAGVLFGLGKGASTEPAGPAITLIGQLASQLPPGLYRLAGDATDPELAAVAWGLGAYRFSELKSEPPKQPPPRLQLPDGVSPDRVMAIIEGVWLGRDLINRPASDLGPAEIEQAVRAIGARHGATVTSIVGDDLLDAGCRLIHAVGRASTRAPRLIDLV